MTRDLHGWHPLVVHRPCTVSLAVASYQNPDGLGQFLYCLKAQTYPDWEAVVMHDGPGPESRRLVEAIGDPRIRFFEEPHRGDFGHHHREEAVRRTTGQVVGVTNEDNWYAPVYFEWMLHTMQRQEAELVYCDMIHSYSKWNLLETSLRHTKIDCGGWLARRAVVDGVPWRDTSYAGDWTYIADLLPRVKRAVKVPGVLFVHN